MGLRASLLKYEEKLWLCNPYSTELTGLHTFLFARGRKGTAKFKANQEKMRQMWNDFFGMPLGDVDE